MVALCSSSKKNPNSHFQNVSWSNVVLAHPKETPRVFYLCLSLVPCPGLQWGSVMHCRMA